MHLPLERGPSPDFTPRTLDRSYHISKRWCAYGWRSDGSSTSSSNNNRFINPRDLCNRWYKNNNNVHVR